MELKQRRRRRQRERQRGLGPFQTSPYCRVELK